MGIGAGAVASLPTRALAQDAAPGPGPYGSIDDVDPDALGLILPPGFSARVIAESGSEVGDTGYRWHAYPDGAATFPDGEGGWHYTCNSEVFSPRGLGGVSVVHFGSDGEILEARRALEGTSANCAGGPTPWGTWLSCEEFDTTGGAADPEPQPAGMVWEVDPTGVTDPVARPAMGIFSHEAVAVDPEGERLYATEDQFDGHLYRYTPDAYPDLASGLLEAADVADDGSVRWVEVPDPTATSGSVRAQLPDVTQFLGGEGIWYHDGEVFFTSKFDGKVHALDVRTDQYRVIYDAGTFTSPVLSGVDNVTVDAGSGDVYVAEDGTDPIELVIITPEGEVAPFVRLTGEQHDGSEITGPCFSPDRTRLYFSSQRGGTNLAREVLGQEENDIFGEANAGITYEVTGPFRGRIEPEPTPTPTAAPEPTATTEPVPTPTEVITAATETPEPADLAAGTVASDDDGGLGAGSIVGIGVGAAAVVGGAAWAIRRRTRTAPDPPTDA